LRAARKRVETCLAAVDGRKREGVSGDLLIAFIHGRRNLSGAGKAFR
jgi:hypothetical protein